MDRNPSDYSPLPKPDPPASPGYGPSKEDNSSTEGPVQQAPLINASSIQSSFLSGEESNLASAAYPDHKKTALPSGASRGNDRPNKKLQLGSLLCVLILILVITTTLPSFVEKITCSFHRGKLRAEYENAGEVLNQVGLEDISKAFELIPQRVVPSVVSIKTVRSSDSPRNDELSSFFGHSRRPESSGQGSGVILDTEGYILTNFHVVQNADEIEVHLSDGRSIKVFANDVIGVDPPTDLAVIKINAEDLLPAEWGESEALEPGSLVWALGSPFGLERSVSSGIVSAKNRGQYTQQPYQDFLQTDVAVNPGNSGGPLVDVHGKVVGINTAIVGESYQGVSFAIPSYIAQAVYNDLINEGSVSRGWLGVQLGAVTEEDAAELGLENKEGAFIVGILGNRVNPSPAMKAGFQPGDVVLVWNGVPIKSPDSLSRQVALTSPGEKATAIVWREGQEIEIEVTVDERPKQYLP